MDVIKQMPDLNAIARAAVTGAVQGIEQGLFAMQRESQRIVHAERYATGQLEQSLHMEILPPDGKRIVGIMGPAAPYGPFVEYDTRAHVAPFAPFLPWATKKGWNATGKSFRAGSKAQLQLARIGWLGVKLHGTKGIHYLRRSYQRHKDTLVQLVQRSVAEAVRRVAG